MFATAGRKAHTRGTTETTWKQNTVAQPKLAIHAKISDQHHMWKCWYGKTEYGSTQPSREQNHLFSTRHIYRSASYFLSCPLSRTALENSCTAHTLRAAQHGSHQYTWVLWLCHLNVALESSIHTIITAYLRKWHKSTESGQVAPAKKQETQLKNSSNLIKLPSKETNFTALLQMKNPRTIGRGAPIRTNYWAES